MDLSRREFLKLTGVGGVVLYLSPLAFSEGQKDDHSKLIRSFSPIDRTLADIAERKYFGDELEMAHRVLWNKEGMKAALAGQRPKEAERTELVIIGGGMSGLTSAYLHRERKPIVLEQASRFGGNSKGQSWRGIDYSIAAAYVVEPEENSEIDKFFTELGIKELAKLKEGDDPVAINSKIFTSFWSGESCGEDEIAKEQFKKLSEYFHKVWDGEELTYPDIPIVEEEQRYAVESLDQKNFKEHLLEVIGGGNLHPHIETALEHYCWSSFGAAFSEISAAAGVNFYAAEFGNLLVCPGGNSAIAERILTKLCETVPVTNLRPSSIVYDVNVSSSGVEVRYLDRNGAVNTIIAKAAVMSCPKFVAAKIVQGLEPQRIQAISQLRYHSYLVANVLLNTPPPQEFYDLYLLGDGRIGSSDIRAETTRKGVTDVILGNFAAASKSDTVLTLYRGIPYDGSRAEIYDPKSYDTVRSRFEDQIKSSILPLLKLSSANVVDLRIARWGHPLPVAAPRLIKDKIVDRLRAPFKSRLFFVEQDNWALPAFETGVTEAFTWSKEIEKVLE